MRFCWHLSWVYALVPIWNLSRFFQSSANAQLVFSHPGWWSRKDWNSLACGAPESTRSGCTGVWLLRQKKTWFRCRVQGFCSWLTLGPIVSFLYSLLWMASVWKWQSSGLKIKGSWIPGTQRLQVSGSCVVRILGSKTRPGTSGWGRFLLQMITVAPGLCLWFLQFS